MKIVPIKKPEIVDLKQYWDRGFVALLDERRKQYQEFLNEINTSK